MGLEGVEIVIAVEETFGIAIADSDAEKMVTPRAVIDHVMGQVGPASRWNREQVAEKVREIVIDVLGCEKQYREDADFVKDLGMG